MIFDSMKNTILSLKLWKQKEKQIKEAMFKTDIFSC